MADDDDATRLCNCWLWAQLEYWRRRRAWVRQGRPIGKEPYIIRRPSRSEPRWLAHWLIGELDTDVDAIRVVSFKPVLPTDEPWWLAWRHFFFRGCVRCGDTHPGDL